MILRLNFACKIAATATADNLGQRATHAERCHWSEGRHNNVGVTAGKVSHNASNARRVTTGKMGPNSSNNKTNTWSICGKDEFLFSFPSKCRNNVVRNPSNPLFVRQ